jgi:hypothetical protein
MRGHTTETTPIPVVMGIGNLTAIGADLTDIGPRVGYKLKE